MANETCANPDRKEEVPKQRTKYPGFGKNLRRYIAEYTENTSLHGVRYISEKHKSLFERIWWIVLTFASLYASIHLIGKAYSKWSNSPVIVSFAQAPTPIWDIPFPSITICPQTKIRQSRFNFTHYYHLTKVKNNMTEEEWNQYADASVMCNNKISTTGNDTTDYSIIDFFKNAAPRRSDLLWLCIWASLNITCDTLFTPVLTGEGICYTSNMLNRDDIFTKNVHHKGQFMINEEEPGRHGWSLENGYPPKAGVQTYPRRGLSSGLAAGLTIVLRGFEYDLDYICNGPIQGYKILLHDPAQVPRVSSNFFILPLNEEILVNVKPDMISTSENLRRYRPQQRFCYFSNERKLSFFRKYTQQNCEMECLTNYTRQTCNCVAYYMPRNKSTPICANSKLRCLKDVADGMIERQVNQGLNRSQSSTAENSIECNCLPACTTLTFNSEFSQTKFDWQFVLQSFQEDPKKTEGWHLTRMVVFFKEMQFISSTRNELYGITDFLANCGGLLGLFIGFSFLSVVEILYFMTLRLWCNTRRHGRHYWNGAA